MNDIKVKFEQQQMKLICKIDGDFDAYHSADIKKMIKEQIETSNHRKLVIDMSDVPYIDSAGLGTMVAILKDARNYGKEVILTSMRQNVKRILK